MIYLRKNSIASTFRVRNDKLLTCAGTNYGNAAYLVRIKLKKRDTLFVYHTSHICL